LNSRLTRPHSRRNKNCGGISKMKIKKIKKIKNLATFDNFQCPDNCDKFGQFNFFYGWNYSGKTTLSRIFRCLEIKKQHPDFPNAEFSLETDNENITQQDISRDYPIRVFNEDFVEENFKWNDEKHEISPVLLLSKKSIELENKVAELTEEKQNSKKLLRETSGKKQNKENQISQSLTNKAREIRNILGITNSKDFDKNTLEDKINKVEDNYKKHILSNNQYQSLLNTIRITTQYEVISEINIYLKLVNFIDDVKNILNKKITAQQIIEKLKNNAELNSWVRKGIDLHKNETICQFCGNKLPSDLFDRLNKHFPDEFDKLIEEIENKKIEITNHKSEIERFETSDKARFFLDYQVQYEEKQKSLKTELNSYVESLEVLLNKLKEKSEQPFNKLDFGDINNNQQTIEKIVRDINKIITDNNLKIQNLGNEKNQAKKTIIKHFVAKSIDEIGYFDLKLLISIYGIYISKLTNDIKKKQDSITDINKKIKAEAIGAEKINVYLIRFFNDGKLKLNLLDNGKYQIFRDNKIAKNLSTGEKNIIALIYFFTRLEEKNFELNQSIIFIDDPVSSLDNNHTFKIYGFLNEKLKDCGQMFITTHNFNFFNLLKDLNNKGAFFLVKKISNNNGDKKSVIENLPDVLFKFKSEYNYLFSILKEFNETNDKSNFELLYIMPNIIRRFLEAYLFMKYPDGKKFKNKTEKFFKNENTGDISEKQSTLKLLDEYSHEESPDHAQKFPDINEVENAVKFILDKIKGKDKGHYKALCESLNANSN